LADGAASANVPVRLLNSTAAAAGVVDGPPLTAKVIALTEGVLRSMLLTKIKSAIAICLVVGITALGTGGVVSRSLAGATADSPGKGRTNPNDGSDRGLEVKQQPHPLHAQIARRAAGTQT